MFRDPSFRERFRADLRNPKPGTVFQGNWQRVIIAVRCLRNGPNQSGADGRSLNEQWSELAFTSEDAVLPFSRIAERMLLFLRTGTGMGLHPASGATLPL